MPSSDVEKARKLAHHLSQLDTRWSSMAVKALLELADKLDYLEERDTISDSKIALLQDYSEGWKGDAMGYQNMLEQLKIELETEKLRNHELRKQVQMLKAALLTS